MVKRLIIVLLILVPGLSAVTLLPEAPPIREAAVTMELPGRIMGWVGTAQEPSKEERKILADDTEFEKANYAEFPPRSEVEQVKQVNVSMVMSGHDLNNSIHDPVRCARAQGFKGIEVSSRIIKLDDGAELQIKRMESYLEFPKPDGGTIQVPFLTYFWFVGADVATPSHYTRTLIDMKGRVFGGYNQRWVYFNLSTAITSGELGDLFPRDEAETDKVLERFAKVIYRECVDHSKVEL